MSRLAALLLTATLGACSKAPEPPAAAEPAQQAAPSVDVDKLEKGALAGNYQDMRNYSYWLTGGYDQMPHNPILGCAWRLVILESGSTSVDASDVSNKELYCDKRLGADEQTAAKAQAKELLKQVKAAK